MYSHNTGGVDDCFCCVYADVMMVDTNGDGKADTMVQIQGAAERGLLKEVEEKRMMTQLATEYYEWFDNIIALPTILITAISGLLSFASTGTFASKELSVFLSLAVGALATIATVLGTIGRTVCSSSPSISPLPSPSPSS